MDQSPKLKNIAQVLFTAMNMRDFSEVEQSIAEEVAFHFPGPGRIEGKKRVLVFLKALMRKYAALTFLVSDVIVENQRACAVWTNRGESVEGKPYKNSGITLFHFQDGKIVFMSDYFKDTSFVQNT